MSEPQDRRTRRTRQALVSAFNALVLNGGPQKIRVTDIIAQADVARSTFYEHYANADELEMQALADPLGLLADAIVDQSRASKSSLTALLEHFWDYRQRARTTFAGRSRMLLSRVLTEQLTRRLALRTPKTSLSLRLASMQLAEGPLALIHAWIRGDLRCAPEVLAQAIVDFAHPATGALFEPASE